MPEIDKPEQTESKKSVRKILFLGVAALLVLGVAGVAVWFVLRPSTNPTERKPKAQAAPEIKSVLHLESFIVNLADPDENRFLRVGIDLGLENEKGGRGGEEQGGVPMARVRDTILGVLNTWRSDALLAPEGKTKLKEELIRALRQRVPELGVREVYFTDFLVQR